MAVLATSRRNSVTITGLLGLLLCSVFFTGLAATELASSKAALNVTSLTDVCTFCRAATTYACGTPATTKCLTAIRRYTTSILNITQPYCSCYNLVASQLLQLCPVASPVLAYLNNCDTTCQYGITCPVKPTLFSLASSANVVPTGKTAASGLVVLNYLGDLTGPKICYKVLSTVKSVDQLTLNIGVKGVKGNLTLTLFSPRKVPANYTGCTPVSSALWRAISASPSAYYAQIYTAATLKNGLARGQLVETPHLAGQLSNAAGTSFLGYIDLSFTSSAVTYIIQVGKGLPPLVSASIIGSRVPLFPFFGPGIANATLTGGITPPTSSIFNLLANPSGYKFQAFTNSPPGVPILASLSDLVSVRTTLIGAAVVPPTKVLSKSSLSATVGGGAFCYSVKVAAGLGPLSLATVRQGVATKNGPIVAVLFGGGFVGALPQADKGCVTLTSDVFGQIALNPSGYYVLFSTTSLPNGAVRGQLQYK